LINVVREDGVRRLTVTARARPIGFAPIETASHDAVIRHAGCGHARDLLKFGV
jgi:hypothetical protein